MLGRNRGLGGATSYSVGIADQPKVYSESLTLFTASPLSRSGVTREESDQVRVCVRVV
jgi:hypothetical protein